MSLVAESRVDCAVDCDVVPGELAIRFDEVPHARARLGRRSRRNRRSFAWEGIGGPRLRAARSDSSCDDRCSKNAELVNGGPLASTWTIVAWKKSVTRHSLCHMHQLA